MKIQKKNLLMKSMLLSMKNTTITPLILTRALTAPRVTMLVVMRTEMRVTFLKNCGFEKFNHL